MGWVDPFGLAGCSSDAKKLAENIGNKHLFPNHYTHHIVMSNSKDPRMKALRDKMESLGIDINSKNNGIWLPNTLLIDYLVLYLLLIREMEYMVMPINSLFMTN